MSAILEDGKLRLSGYVGDYYYEDGFTSSDVVIALADVDDASALTVYLNSGGGIATEGAAIHALLSARKGKTDVVVEGIAASAASLIAMAGKTVTMSAGAVMMIHDPSGYTIGTSQDHAKTIEGLEALATAYARVYAAKSGKTAAQCREIMKEERWLTPQQAVSEGFADRTTETQATPVAAFDYRAYARAPERLVALAASKNWTRERPEVAAKMSSPDAEKERIKAILGSPEAKGREDLAQHLAFESGSTVAEAVAALSKSNRSNDGELPDKATFEASRQPIAAGGGLQDRPTAPGLGAGAGLARWGKVANHTDVGGSSMAANMRKILEKGKINANH
ncbi:Clp protease ClpP [Rhizobium leguminosarum bv. viciae]|uniref:head maturation protease, ClpP-related n=1 Tax=Rhizobium leguminosarum TaxID=384 RepID=UPI0014419DC2|nr:head maturation protease, ClpP-related [Rhizobium leguminosarum]NKK92384.1 Clp protease ClpP [Rhizobium leguminosarum bv. viciae]